MSHIISSKGPAENSRELSLPDPLVRVNQFLDNVNQDPKIEEYRKLLLEKRQSTFKPNVKYFVRINGLYHYDPESAKAFFHLELKNLLKNPQLYGKIQRTKLLELASNWAGNGDSTLSTVLSSDEKLFNEVMMLPYLNPASVEQIVRLRPKELIGEAIEKVAENSILVVSTILSTSLPADKHGTKLVSFVFNYLNDFSDSEFVSEVLKSIGKKFPLQGHRLMKLLVLFAKNDDLMKDQESYDSHSFDSIFGEDIYFVQSFINGLKKQDYEDLSAIAKNVCAKFPDVNILVEEAKVSLMTEVSKYNIDRALKNVEMVTEAIKRANENLDTIQMDEMKLDIIIHHYRSPAELEIFRIPGKHEKLSLNRLADILKDNHGSVIRQHGIPPELKADFEGFLTRVLQVKARFQPELAKRYELAIPEIVAKNTKNFELSPSDDHEAVLEKIASLKMMLDQIDRLNLKTDDLFPDQYRELLNECRKALLNHENVLKNALPEKHRLNKTKKLQEAESIFNQEIIRARIEFLLKKYGIELDLPLDKISVSIFTSEKEDLMIDHVQGISSSGKSHGLNYEIGQEKEFMKMKEQAIDLIIPHEIGHVIIDEQVQLDHFTKDRTEELKRIKALLDKEQGQQFESILRESIIDGVGFDLSLNYGGTKTQAGDLPGILKELSLAFINLEKAISLQDKVDDFKKLLMGLRMLSNLEHLLEEVSKANVPRESVQGFFSGKLDYEMLVTLANQKIKKTLPEHQLTAMRAMMKEAVEFGRSIKKYSA